MSDLFETEDRDARRRRALMSQVSQLKRQRLDEKILREIEATAVFRGEKLRRFELASQKKKYSGAAIGAAITQAVIDGKSAAEIERIKFYMRSAVVGKWAGEVACVSRADGARDS